MDEHTVTLMLTNGKKWEVTTSDLKVAENTFARWGRVAHDFGSPPLYLQHIVSTLNGTSRVEYCERSVEWGVDNPAQA